MRAISLLYHDVVKSNEFDASGFPGKAPASYKLEIGEFNRHLKAIAQVVTEKPASVLDLLGGSTGSTPFLLTFDDGGSSAATYIADILEGMGWHAHFFITANYIGAPSFLSPAQIRDLRNRGHVIGTHSCSHPVRMSYCTWDQLIKEWGTSIRQLSDILGEQVIVASVPGGYYSKKVAEAASFVGLRALFTSEPTTRCHYLDGCLILGRYTLLRGMQSSTAAAIASGQFAPRLRRYLFWNIKKAVKYLGSDYYLKLRRLYFAKDVPISR